jgi:hypothetical protein
MTRKLILITGGRQPPAPPGAPPPRHKGKKRRRPYWLVNLLWYATCRYAYDLRAADTAEVGDRMTDLSDEILGHHFEVSVQQAAHALALVRRKPFDYGFSVIHVEKGATPMFRGYVPILVDLDRMHTPITLINEDDLVFCIHGMVSSASTVATMLRNEATIVLLLAGLFDEAFTNAASEWRDVADRAEQLVVVAKAMV